MSAGIYAILLSVVMVIAVAWPLLLAIPTLHSRLYWPRHLAIVPAALLVVLPGNVSLQLPWLLFGTRFTIDGTTRWVLAMSVVIWFTAATMMMMMMMKPSKQGFANERSTTFFLLTLAGNLGAVLASDLVSFFCFSTIMSYGFYGLFIQNGNAATQHAGRLYLIFLIVADLLLFEALLLAAFTTDNLRFEGVREAMAKASSSQFYLWVTFIGFALKTGIWPAHLWLSSVFKSTNQTTALLIIGVPIVMGWLGAARWLPLGEHAFGISAMIIQMVGVIVVLYATLKLFTQASVKIVWATSGATGLFITALGTGLAHPTVWRQYEYLSYPFITSLGILLALLIFAIGRTQETRHQQPAIALQRMKALSRWIGATRQWVEDRLLGLQSLCHVSWLKVAKHYQCVNHWQKLRGFTTGWSTAITLFVLLGLALTWLAA